MPEQRPHQISIQNNPSQASLFSSLLKTTFNPLTHGQMILNNTTLTLEAPGGPVRQEQSLKTAPWRTGPAASSTSWAVAQGREDGRGERRFCPLPSRGFSARCTFPSTAARAPSPGPAGNPRHGEARSERRGGRCPRKLRSSSHRPRALGCRGTGSAGSSGGDSASRPRSSWPRSLSRPRNPLSHRCLICDEEATTAPT